MWLLCYLFYWRIVALCGLLVLGTILFVEPWKEDPVLLSQERPQLTRPLDSTANGSTGFGLFTTQGSTVIPLCYWETRESRLDAAGGRLRAHYTRSTDTRELSCEAYYHLIQQAYEDRRIKQTQGYRFDPLEVWQCWYDDPCSGEAPRR